MSWSQLQQANIEYAMW